MSLQGREVILGVGGGISAYKSAELLRRLQDLGLQISVVPTRASLNFVGKATWEALSHRPVNENLWNNISDVAHIKSARIADAIIVAPTTADLLAKFANGIADDLLTNIFIASSAPKILIPAMHTEMWENAATQKNVQILRERGILVIEPDTGRLTGNDVGSGRYPEISRLISEISSFLDLRSDLLGRKVLISAGGTREAIDPVRFIANRSTGKQGYAIAVAARNRGADVILVSANVSLQEPEGIKIIKVESAAQMAKTLTDNFPDCDILVMSAAVADARPALTSSKKLPKSEYRSIELVENIDILKTLSSQKEQQFIIAFAAETGDGALDRAKSKIATKGADLLYLNDVSDGAIFGQDSTEGWILNSTGEISKFETASKDTLANELLDQALIKLS
jgi:phosphopantothenoylcysteine decarboxylase / phosphopantothenate---cysteine ligase